MPAFFICRLLFAERSQRGEDNSPAIGQSMAVIFPMMKFS
jgi:hypothetical protein